ncbi:PHB depolymerase family esterase [Nocardia sp. NPDC051030]|uniref:extracellular catalytic domain type 1 short-chain-length polyhydroxyalkanoate depolymerase n=1 Tax=Nocardia sp. NPDC051030 TaxID=3155162 RepID=UPI00343F6B6D
MPRSTQGITILRRLAAAATSVLALAATILCAGAVAVADTGETVIAADYTNAAGTRHYFVYAPPGDTAGLPLVVWLHGCGGSISDDDNPPDDVITTDFLAQFARDRGFVVVYPIQPWTSNLLGCWNWFDAANQHRDAGEPSIIAGITETVRAQFHSDPSRVYLIGHSSGGLMATILGAAYPDRYAAISTWCSAAYQSSTDVTGAEAFREMGPRARPIPTFLVEDGTDVLSTEPIGRLAVNQWLGTNALALGRTGPLPPPTSVERFDADPSIGFRAGGILESHDMGPIQVQLLTVDDGGHNLRGSVIGVGRQALDFLFRYRLP